MELGLGVLFAALAVQQWRSRPRPGRPATTPAWMTSLDSMTPGKAFRLAALLSGANPMNLPLTVGAAAIIGGATNSTGARVVALILFVLIASSSLLVTLGVYLLGGDRTAATLEGLKVWMTAHGAAVMTAVLALLAVTYIGDAIGALGRGPGAAVPPSPGSPRCPKAHAAATTTFSPHDLSGLAAAAGQAPQPGPVRRRFRLGDARAAAWHPNA
ncbi:GAP family protein [Streptomyces sp. NPDC101194]|uniref:GAP family protein n=1 Tax=Streptomyces sp. NPDC101194 TaxID=3366127 RepID=UPI00381B4B25